MSKFKKFSFAASFLTAIVFCFVIFASSALAVTFGISGNRFTVDGQTKFLTLISYFDALRASDNTISSDLDYLKSKGIDGIRILPNWWGNGTGGNYTNDNLMDSNGNLRQAQLTKLKGIIETANSKGMIVDVSFAREVVQNLSIDNYKKGVTNTIVALQNYHNVFYDLQNEYDNNGLNSNNIKAIRDSVKAQVSSAILSASAGIDAAVSVANSANLEIINCHDSRSNDWYSQTASRINSILPASKPIYFGEPEKWTSGSSLTSQNFITAVTQAKQAGAAAWTFHTRAGFNLTSSSIQNNLNPGVEKAFLNSFKTQLDATTWGGGGGNPPPSGGRCPSNGSEIGGANASNTDPTATDGYWCDDDPFTTTQQTVTLSCTSSTGVAFIASNQYGGCNMRENIRPGWTFSSGRPQGITLIAEVSCPGTKSVDLPAGNYIGGAWTTHPSTEGIICTQGAAAPPAVPPTEPTGPPTINSINPTTAVSGQTIEIRGQNLPDTVKLQLSSGLFYTITGSANQDRTVLSFEPGEAGAGTYTVIVTGTNGTATAPQTLQITEGGSAFQHQQGPGVPTGYPGLGELIQQIIYWSIRILGIAVFVMIFIAGMQWFFAGGNTTIVNQARSKITNAIVGAIILVSAYVILNTINPDFVRGVFTLPGIGNQNQTNGNQGQ